MKTVFITGGGKNTGFAISEKFAQNGYSVAFSIRDIKAADEISRNISEKYNVKVKGYYLDLNDLDNIHSVFTDVYNDFGSLDTFVANAADLGVGQDFLTVTETDYDRVMNTNVKGTYFCCQNAAKLMKEQGGGSIVLIGSVHYKKSIFDRSVYAASKGALAALTRSAAFELGAFGIRVNYIVAGAIKTDRWNALSEEEIAAKRKNWPLGIESIGEDIANGAFYLGSDLSKTVTGTDLTIDSGVSICLLPYNGGKSR